MTLHGPVPVAFEERRRKVREDLEGAVLFLPEIPEALYANDVHYPYRPDTNIRYLCGFEEPAALILTSHGGEEDGFTLCVRPRDEHSETWTGKRAGVEGAREQYGADFAHPLEKTYEILLKHLRLASRLFYAYSPDPAVNQKVMAAVHQANLERPRRGGDPITVSEAAPLLAEHRLRKRPEEIDLLRKAGHVSGKAHARIVETLSASMTEYQVQAQLEHDFRYGGCTGPAYGSICAGGADATILHYTRNDKVLIDGELILIDAAGEYGGYCADITRTYPVGKTYSPAQAELYDLVLAAQLASIDAIRPGVTIEAVHKTAVRVLTQGMLDLGLLQGTLDDCLEKNAHQSFYMHNTSHWLGMDVHDAGTYRVGESSRTLEPGMVLTVEPGIYLRATAEVDERFHGIGIRIEDDVLVTADGHENLTSEAPKDRHEIERIRASATN